MNELTIKKELNGQESSKAKQIEAVFAPMVEMLKEFEGEYDKVMALEQSPEKCAKAKRLRLDVAKVRIEADKVRKVQKEEYLRAGNAIQGVYNVLKFAVVDKEEKLKDVELHYERIEEAKRAKLQADRVVELSQYDIDGASLDLAGMEDAIWSNFLAGTKANYEAVKEAERKAEEVRVAKEKAEAAERERVRLENEELKKQQAIMERERKKAEAKARAEHDKLTKEKEEAEAKARLIEKQHREKAEAEAESRRKEAEAPDIEKLNGWADSLEAKIETLSTAKAKTIVSQAVNMLRTKI